MKKAIYLAVLGGFGDVTHSTQIARRFARDLNIEVIFIAAHPKKGGDVPSYDGVVYKWYPYDEINALKYLITRILFEIQSFFSCLSVKNPLFFYERHRALGFSGYFASKILKKPYFLEVNTIIELDMEIETFSSRIFYYMNKLNCKCQRFFMKTADLLFTPTNGIKQIMIERYDVNSDKIVVVPNGADSDIFYPMDKSKMRKDIGLPLEKKIVILVGGFKKWHGIDTLIEAVPLVVKKYVDILFLLVGSSKNPALVAELKDKVKELKLEKNVLLTGQIPYDQVPKYVNASDVAVCNISGHERNRKITFTALKMMEYMACGKAMIVTTPCAVDVKIREYNAGGVIEPDDATILANSILKLLDNEDLNLKYGKNALELYKKHYTWDAAAKKTEDEIFKMIDMKMVSRK